MASCRYRLRSAIERGIRARRPEVLITFDADGLYWHPDHIAVHELTTAAVVGAGRRRTRRSTM